MGAEVELSPIQAGDGKGVALGEMAGREPVSAARTGDAVEREVQWYCARLLVTVVSLGLGRRLARPLS